MPPDLPPTAPPTAPPPHAPVSEATILRDIVLALGALPDVFLERINVVAGVGPAGHLVRSAREGIADLIACVRPRAGGPGRFLALEVKSPTGRVRPPQAAWGAALAARGSGLYRIVRSVEEAARAVEEARG